MILLLTLALSQPESWIVDLDHIVGDLVEKFKSDPNITTTMRKLTDIRDNSIESIQDKVEMVSIRRKEGKILEDSIKSLTSELERLRDKQKEITEEIKKEEEYNKEITKMELEQSLLDSKKAEIERRTNKELHAEVTRMNEQQENLKKELSDNIKSNTAKELGIKDMEKALMKVKEVVEEDVVNKLEETKKSIEKIQEQCKDTEIEIKSIPIDEHKEKLECIKQEHKKWLLKVEGRKKVIDSLKDEGNYTKMLGDCQKRVEEYNAYLEEHESGIKSLIPSVTSVKSDTVKIRNEIKNVLKDKISIEEELKLSITEMENKIRKLHEINEKLKKEKEECIKNDKEAKRSIQEFYASNANVLGRLFMQRHKMVLKLEESNRDKTEKKIEEEKKGILKEVIFMLVFLVMSSMNGIFMLRGLML